MANEQRLYNFAPLRNVSALVGLIDRVQNRNPALPGMACYYGWSGYGKTTAGIYAANKFNAVLVQVKSHWGPKYLLQVIARECALEPRKGDSIGHLAEMIAQSLAVNDVPLLVDEADHLVKRKAIELMRDIHEASGAPVILIGEESMPQKIKEWERVHGRMLDWVAAQPGEMDDVIHLAKSYAEGIEIAPDLQAAILDASHKSIRRICVNLDRIAEHARTRGLKRMALDDWQGRFFTGEAPVARMGVA